MNAENCAGGTLFDCFNKRFVYLIRNKVPILMEYDTYSLVSSLFQLLSLDDALSVDDKDIREKNKLANTVFKSLKFIVESSERINPNTIVDLFSLHVDCIMIGKEAINYAHSCFSNNHRPPEPEPRSMQSVIYEDDKGLKVVDLWNSNHPTTYQVIFNKFNVGKDPLLYSFEIEFQSGSTDYGMNGITNEAMLAILLDRTGKLNEQFPNLCNFYAMAHMREAMKWYTKRSEDRKARRVEGKMRD